MNSTTVRNGLRLLGQECGVVITMPWSRFERTGMGFEASVIIEILGVEKHRGNGTGSDPDEARLDAARNVINDWLTKYG